jgi:thiamine-phosphate pyrophosphorylase
MLVTDRRLVGGADALVSVVDEAVAGGATAVQLREKDLPPGELLSLARRLREVTAGRACLIVNGPLEVALACKADGVHLPDVAAMLERPAEALLVGRSVHSLEAARRAELERADYLIAGPIWKAASHPDSTPAGLQLIESISATVAVPVLAIGGVSAIRVRPAISSGAVGVAAVSAFVLDTALETARMRGALNDAWAVQANTVR